MEIDQVLPFHNINDVELIGAINYDVHNYPLSVLNTLTYNKSAERSSNIIDNLYDPVINEPVCDYIFNSDFPTQIFPNNSLKILSYNISSVPQHLDSLYDQCLNSSACGVNYDVVGLCETRLNDNICNLYRLDNYLPYFQNKSTQSGGLAIYLHSKFQGVKVNTACLQLPHIESLFIKVSKPIKFVIGIVYRPPNSIFTDFLVSMEEILLILSNLNLKCSLMGDFNINLLHIHDSTTCYINLFQSYNFSQTIIKPTRVTNMSATLIDYI